MTERKGMGGEVIFDNGLVLPNQFTIAGKSQFVKSAFRGDTAIWHIGAGFCQFSDDLTLAEIVEPQPTTKYVRARTDIRSASSKTARWATIEFVDDEWYAETPLLRFTGTDSPPGPGMSWSAERMFIVDQSTSDVIAVSSAFPDGTRLIDYEFNVKYRLWFR